MAHLAPDSTLPRNSQFLAPIRRHGADPFAYFEWVFEKLMHNPRADQLKELLPVNWLKTRPAANQVIDSPAA